MNLPDRIYGQHKTSFVTCDLKAMTDNGQLSAHRVAADCCQPIIAVFSDLTRSQSVERAPWDDGERRAACNALGRQPRLRGTTTAA
jgi:hypothetical protein